MVSRRVIVLGGAALTFTGGAYAKFRADLASARRAATPTQSRMADTRHGPVEYASAGQGPAVLMLHGTGGGFDQGLTFTRRLQSLGYRVIAPSRFGYLRTPMPADADHWAEADTIADLLDQLGLERVAVAGGSAGAVPALAFAIRYPHRTAACLPIVPAFFLPGRAPVEPWSPVQERMVRALLKSDFLFWASLKLAPRQIIGSILATDPGLVDAASTDEKERVAGIIRGLLPITARADGLLYDNRQTNRPLDLALRNITAPTLAFSCEDDRYRTAENARHIAAEVPGARVVIYPTGGHIWVGRDAELFGEIDTFLRGIGYA